VVDLRGRPLGLGCGSAGSASPGGCNYDQLMVMQTPRLEAPKLSPHLQTKKNAAFGKPRPAANGACACVSDRLFEEDRSDRGQLETRAGMLNCMAGPPTGPLHCRHGAANHNGRLARISRGAVRISRTRYIECRLGRSTSRYCIALLVLDGQTRMRSSGSTRHAYDLARSGRYWKITRSSETAQNITLAQS